MDGNRCKQRATNKELLAEQIARTGLARSDFDGKTLDAARIVVGQGGRSTQVGVLRARAPVVVKGVE